jgi:3-hydroxybutyrate dehydrogenase
MTHSCVRWLVAAATEYLRATDNFVACKFRWGAVTKSATGLHDGEGKTSGSNARPSREGSVASAVRPGPTPKQIPDTARARGITEDQVIKDGLLSAQPTKKFVQIEEVAAFASFLASDAAASITGAVLPIEGGWTAH